MVTKRLLLIDDNEDNRLLVEYALEMNHDWEILTAVNGVEGITKAELERPDIILLDFIMPDLDGLTVCQILKSNLLTCSIPIIFMTAMTQDKVLSELETTLAEGIIIKPFDITSLHSQIMQICNFKGGIELGKMQFN